MAAAERVAERYFESRYARILLAMSMAEAKEILGFPPGTSPSPSEVTRAYKTKAFQNHPDRGGDPSKMVEINVAKDILMGERAPTRTPPRRGPSSPGAPPGGRTPRDKYKPPPPPPPVDGKSFQQVLSSMPSGVDWKFASDYAFASDTAEYPDELKDEESPFKRYSRYFYGWVVYGQTEQNHVFAGIRVKMHGSAVSGFKNEPLEEGGWEGFYTSAPRKLNLIRLAPKMIRGIIEGLPDMGDVGVKPKKFQVLNGPPTMGTFKQRGGLSLKDAIIGSGAMPQGASGLKGRKKVVTVEPVYSRAKFQALKEELGRVTGTDYHRAFIWNVEVNGKGRSLDDKEVEKLNKSGFLWAVFKYDYDKGKKNLSRLRGGKWLGADAATALKLLYDALHGGHLKTGVGQAMEQMTATKKAMVRLAAEMPLSHVAMLLDESLYAVCSTVTHG